MPELQAQLADQKRRVDFDTYDISVKELLGMITDGLIDIAPDYQRHFVWQADRESTFIESVFLGIPIPSLYMATNVTGKWEVIDGVQRLSTLLHFAGDDLHLSLIGRKSKLQLQGLTKLTQFNGKYFAQLPTAVQLQFLLKPLKVTTISDKSDLHVRFDLFERLNTGGILLMPQEIRACIYRGAFNDFLRALATYTPFRSVVRLPSQSEHNGTREEFALRYFAYLNEYRKFEHSVTDFLNDYMERATKLFDYNDGRSSFEQTFSFLAQAFPRGITRKGKRYTPVNLFEAVAVGAGLAFRKSSKLNSSSPGKWVDSEELRQYTMGGTNTPKMVQKRIEFCRDKFLQV